MAALRTIAGIPLVPARLFPLVFAGAVVLFAAPPGVAPAAADWALALTAALVSVAGGTWPWAVVAVQSVLLVVAAGVAPLIGRDVVEVLAALALMELLMRRDGRRRAIGVVPVAAATVISVVRAGGGDLARMLIWNLALVGAATMLGVYLWSLRLWMRRYHEQLQEIERLHEAGTIAARATERTAIARELHDLVAHHVASIVLRVGVARHVAVDGDSRFAEVLADVHETGSAALADLRELVGVLRDPSTVHGDPHEPLLDPADLPLALAAVVTRVEQAGLAVDAEIDPAVADLDAVRRLAVLRITQEGLTNALKHARDRTGATLRVRLAENGAVDIEVRDDGAAQPVPRPDSGGHGLVGLRERVELTGGRFLAGPDAAGWRVHARLPAPAEREGDRR
ncbi:sensor histidine kinase [Amycolatopsis sp. H20-H5]|uniref:sensor histidine kinase n=1 Tax=Amycolatopsis sp. H20-H5 TaxID=3046309 RepID=UPI002DB701E5|nr:histidine kinase [Amycolatopsis sp. H20-H5]MEC3980809.1 histidine kinase [Amycolatopsis sp. H20-H5]